MRRQASASASAMFDAKLPGALVSSMQILAWGLLLSAAAVALGVASGDARAQSGTSSPTPSTVTSPTASATPSGTPPATPTTTPALQQANDLAADGASASEKKVPVLLFFNRVGCPYCERALREYLKPMAANAGNDGRVMIRQVETDRPTKMVDFGGEVTTHRKFAARYRVKLTPTIWIVDGGGNLLVEPIVGLTTPDYYGYYLDRAIEDSLKKVRTGG